MVFKNGAAGFNPWATPGGDVAMYEEAHTLDKCMGHSAPGNSYHYHSLPYCNRSKALGYGSKYYLYFS